MSDAQSIVPTATLGGLAAVALAMVLTTGPNMARPASRTIRRGRVGRR